MGSRLGAQWWPAGIVSGSIENREAPVTSSTDTLGHDQAARIAAEALADKKGMDIVLLDVGDLLQVTEVFVVVSGGSRPHVRTLADAVEEKLEEHGRRPLRDEGRSEAEWVLLDYGDFVVHVFQPGPREFYGLERLWGDAERTEWEPAQSEA